MSCSIPKNFEIKFEIFKMKYKIKNCVHRRNGWWSHTLGNVECWNLETTSLTAKATNN